jgi:hypothetical protein
MQKCVGNKMKYKNPEEMKDDIKSLGMCALSKFSAISHLSKLKFPLEAMIMLESLIREMECGLWTLVPLGVGNDSEMFEKQINHLTNKFGSIVNAAKAMKNFKDTL